MAGDFDFSGKSALITGAASGIGAATARWLDAHGIARLVLIDMDRPGLDTLALSAETTMIGGDVADPALWALSMRDVGTLDCVALNAGMAPRGSPITETDIAQWKKCMAVNLDGVFLGLRQTMKRMQKGGGSIVVTASAAALGNYPGTAAYSVSKAAVMQLVRIAAVEGAERSIRVNAVAPGPVDTAMWNVYSGKDGAAEALDMAKRATKLSRIATPAEIAGTIGFLLSDMAVNVTGTVMVTDGGATL